MQCFFSEYGAERNEEVMLDDIDTTWLWRTCMIYDELMQSYDDRGDLKNIFTGRKNV